mgnify:CR=1 FL=1
MKYDYILRELAASMDLDEDGVINDHREAMIQAKMMSEIQAMMPPAPAAAARGKPRCRGLGCAGPWARRIRK